MSSPTSSESGAVAATLEELAARHGTDKLRHGYIPYYERYLGHLRARPVSVLEIGVGGFDDPHAGGESLRMWRDYFARGRIVGLDIFPKELDLGARVTIHSGSQKDPEVLDRLVRDHGPFDVIIDDGGHQNRLRNFSFLHLFGSLKPHGIYVMEDLHTSYWPRRLGGNAEDFDDATTSMGFLKTLLDGLAYEYIPGREPQPFDPQIVGLSFHSKIAFIERGTNEHAITPLERRTIAKQGR
jgi:hypothetical protein